jgi:hypothetical protein
LTEFIEQGLEGERHLLIIYEETQGSGGNMVDVCVISVCIPVYVGVQVWSDATSKGKHIILSKHWSGLIGWDSRMSSSTL